MASSGSAGPPSKAASALHAGVCRLTESIVREYLVRTNCAATLAAFDASTPSRPAFDRKLPKRLRDAASLAGVPISKVDQAADSSGGASSAPRLTRMVDYIRAASKRRRGRASAQAPAPALAVDGSRRAAGGAAAADEDGWTREQVRALRAAMKAHPRTLDKRERFRLIAADVGKSKKECYQKAKELRAKAAAAKEAKEAAAASSKQARRQARQRRGHGHGAAKHGGRHADATMMTSTNVAAAKRGGGPRGGSADALDALLDPTAAARNTKAAQSRRAAADADDGWGDMLSHVQSATASTASPPAAKGSVRRSGGRRTRSSKEPARSPPQRRGGGWGAPSDGDGDARPRAAQGGWGSNRAPRAGAGSGAGAGAGMSRRGRGPRVGADGILVIEDEEEEESGDNGEGAQSSPRRAGGAGAASPPTDDAPGWGAVLRRGPRDPTSLLESAKRDDNGEMVVEDALDLEAEFAAAPVVRRERAVDTMKVVPPSSLGFRGRGISEAQCIGLRKLLYGDATRSFNEAWLQQGFFFSEVPHLGYGIVQTEGGPCGPLASVNAYVVRNLLFKGKAATTAAGWDEPSSEDQASAVVDAVVEMLWQARERGGPARMCIEGARPYVQRSAMYKPDRFTEKMVIYEARTREELNKLVRSQLPVFMKPDGHGCCLFVYSVMLTRTVAGINADMDSALGMTSKLIGAHNYATQEMVNLLLCGRAHSNVFNGTMKMEGSGDDAITLRGVPSRSTIGFVTLFEHYGYVAVGTHYHKPLFPVWVVCSESHYSVLFSTAMGQADSDPRKAFDLFYYDPLARQDEILKLTVDPATPPADLPPEDMPPLDLCIRTRWKNSAVDWNGAEPLL